MTPDDLHALIDVVNSIGAMIAGFISALIFAVTWKG